MGLSTQTGMTAMSKTTPHYLDRLCGAGTVKRLGGGMGDRTVLGGRGEAFAGVVLTRSGVNQENHEGRARKGA